MNIKLNGENRELAERCTLEQLVQQLSLTPQRVAIELNQSVVRRNQWAQTLLNEGDRVEIVHFVGGGSEADREGGRIYASITEGCKFISTFITKEVFIHVHTSNSSNGSIQSRGQSVQLASDHRHWEISHVR